MAEVGSFVLERFVTQLALKVFGWVYLKIYTKFAVDLNTSFVFTTKVGGDQSNINSESSPCAFQI